MPVVISPRRQRLSFLLRRSGFPGLRQAEARVEKITLDASGKPVGTTPLDVD